MMMMMMMTKEKLATYKLHAIPNLSEPHRVIFHHGVAEIALLA